MKEADLQLIAWHCYENLDFWGINGVKANWNLLVRQGWKFEFW